MTVLTQRKYCSNIYILQTNLVLVLYDIYGAVTRMEESQRIQRSRKGHRAHLTKVLNKATTIMESDEAPNAMQIASLTATIEQLARKRTVLNELNEKFLATITDPDDIEQEIMDVEDIECEINEKSAQISAFILSCHPVKNPVTPPTTSSQQQVSAPPAAASPQQQVSAPPVNNTSPQEASESQPTTSSTSPTLEVNLLQFPPVNQELSVTLNETEGINTMTSNTMADSLLLNNQSNQVLPTSQTHLTPAPSHVSRLPKLNLPTFSGNPLNWNTFWDSFNVAVNSNPNLEGYKNLTT